MASIVEPRDPAAATAPAPAPAAPAAPAPVVEPAEGVTPPVKPPAGAASLPDDLIRLPAVQALLAGEPPAVSASIEAFSKRPEGQLIAKNAPLLQQAGMGLYKSTQGDLGVLFNQMYITPQELIDADKAGKLTELAPPFDDVNHTVATSGDKNPVLKAKPPTGFKKTSATPIPPPVPASNIAPAPSKQIVPKMNAQKIGSPTSGAKPGAGRLLNSILKPVV